MDGDVELDNVKVVNVTGKSYKDKPRSSEKKKCWNPSIRVRTVIIYISVAVIFVVGAIVLVTELRKNWKRLDEDALKNSIDRFVMLFVDDARKVTPYCKHAAWQRVTAEAVMEATELRERFKDNPMYIADGPAIQRFVKKFLNTSVVYHENGTIDRVYGCNSMINFWAFIDSNTFDTIWFEYHPGTDEQFCSLAPINGPRINGPPLGPFFPNSYIRSVIRSSNDTEKGWLSIFSPAIFPEPMFISIEAIMIPDEDGVIRDKTVYGYLFAGKIIKRHMHSFATDVPCCISVHSTTEDEASFDDEDKNNWNASVAGYLSDDKIFNGVPYFSTRDPGYLDKCETRYCPDNLLFNDTKDMMVGYFTLCGQDPKKTDRTTCLSYRIDRPMSRVAEGTNPIISLSALVIGIMIIIFVVFIIFLDCAILRRVVNLSESIRKQTSQQKKADLKRLDEDDKPISRKGKKGKSSGRSSKSSGEESSQSGDGHHRSGDEIRNLQLAVEQNTKRVRKRVEAINGVIKLERQKILHHKMAMQLLTLWCDRTDFFPGLRPDSVLLRYEPTRSLDDLLWNPLSVEYLKSHCDTDCTLENLFFLLDVSWLSEIESAEDKEEDPAKKKQIHLVASKTAAVIVARYIAEDAPQQINISAATFKILRQRDISYKRGMFKEAVKEVKLMLTTDILPRFQSSAAYTAMSENLYVDAIAEEDSEWSSESVSTAGSVLSDETNSGTPNVVDFNFRNLYAAFHGDSDLGSTYTNESSVIEDFDVDDPASSSVKTGSSMKPRSGMHATETHASTVSSSTKDSSSVHESKSKQQENEESSSSSSSSSSSDTQSSDSS